MKKNLKFSLVILFLCFVFMSTYSYASRVEWNTVLPANRIRKDVSTGTSSSTTDYCKVSCNYMDSPSYQIRARIWCHTKGSWATAQRIIDKATGMKTLSFYDDTYLSKGMTLAVSNNMSLSTSCAAYGYVTFNP